MSWHSVPNKPAIFIPTPPRWLSYDSFARDGSRLRLIDELFTLIPKPFPRELPSARRLVDIARPRQLQSKKSQPNTTPTPGASHVPPDPSP